MSDLLAVPTWEEIINRDHIAPPTTQLLIKAILSSLEATVQEKETRQEHRIQTRKILIIHRDRWLPWATSSYKIRSNRPLITETIQIFNMDLEDMKISSRIKKCKLQKVPLPISMQQQCYQDKCRVDKEVVITETFWQILTIILVNLQVIFPMEVCLSHSET